MQLPPTKLRLVALSSVMFGATLFGPISQAKTIPQNSFRQLTMMTPQAGWTIRNGAIVRTLDGGQHWSVVASVPSNPSIADFVSPEIAVVAVQPPQQVGKHNATVWETADGAQHWVHYALPDSRDGVGGLQFFNRAHGWATTNMEGASAQEDLVLLHTTTAGKTWSRSPASAGVIQSASARRPRGAIPYDGIKNAPVFTTPLIGWISGGTYSNRPVWLGTADGGNTWTPSPLPTKVAGLSITWTESPVFVTASVGWLPVESGSHALGFLYTHNQGRRWKPASPDFDTTTAVGSAMQWSFAGTSDGWLLDHVSNRVARFYYTANQGHRWIRLNTHQPIHTWQQIDFVSSTIGFAIARQPNGSDTLWHTENAGHSWSQITQQ
jgi:photosystem II stability/assembly factor-like uncharacterized protein